MRTPLSTRRTRRRSFPLSLERLEGRVVPSFLAAQAFDAGGRNLRSLAMGDFNGDGRQDLAAANYDGGNVSVALGNGDGAFQAARSFATGTNPTSVAAGEFNGDGRLDLAVTNLGNRSVGIHLGNGDGTFQFARYVSVGNQPLSVAVGDVNADGRLDLAVTSFVTDGTGSVGVLLGNGDGSFRGGGGGSTGRRPYSVAMGDFNGDGRLDLATANQDGNNASVLLGNGDGSFQIARHFNAGSMPRSVAVGDFDGDGRLDLATANYGLSAGGSVSVLLGNGDGTLQAARNLPAGRLPSSIQVADFNLDGNPDLAVANFSRDSAGVFLGTGGGSFQAVRHLPGNRTFAVAVGDVNNDGFTDLATANYLSNTVSVTLGNGDGSFRSAPTETGGIDPRSVATGDVNGDGRPDFVAAYRGDENTFLESGVRVHLGNGDGSFQAAPLLPAGLRPVAVALADLNGDTHLDLVVVDETANNVRVLLGNGDGTFQPARQFAAGTRPISVEVTNVDGDGHFDLVVANAGNPPAGDFGNVSVFLGNGDGTFQGARNSPANFPLSTAAGDFNGDGRQDLVVANQSALFVLLGNGDGSFQVPRVVPIGTFALAAGDFNGDGRLDLATASYNLVAGIGSASVRLGNGDGTFQEPRGVNAGGGARAVVVADFNGDGYQDVAVGGGTVRVLLGNGDGTLQATHVSYLAGSVPGALAVADFDGDGSADLAVANATLAAALSSNNVSVLLNDGYWGGPVVSFAIDPYSATVSMGSALDVTVYPLNAFFEIVTNYTGQILFWSTDPLATTPNVYRFQRSDRGIASFPAGLTFNTPGVQELYVFDTATYSLIGYAVFTVVGAGPGGAPGGGSAPDLFAGQELGRGVPAYRPTDVEMVPLAGSRQDAGDRIPKEWYAQPDPPAKFVPVARFDRVGAVSREILDLVWLKDDLSD